jgi:phosphoribosyl 1,2-cyclic phosphodiesterase
MVNSPNMNIQPDNHIFGLNFFNRMFDGISNSTYGTKKITSAVLNRLLTVKFSSLDRPNILAFEMFTLQRMRHFSTTFIQRTTRTGPRTQASTGYRVSA